MGYLFMFKKYIFKNLVNKPCANKFACMVFFYCLSIKKLLSLGAVFGMLGGIYYWFDKITGVKYPETLGKIHFWIFFVGANLTFFPMHFLGIAGMPRRIPDYPDAFTDFNQIASYGSYLSAFSALFFFYIVFISFTNKNNYSTVN